MWLSLVIVIATLTVICRGANGSGVYWSMPRLEHRRGLCRKQSLTQPRPLQPEQSLKWNLSQKQYLEIFTFYWVNWELNLGTLKVIAEKQNRMVLFTISWVGFVEIDLLLFNRACEYPCFYYFSSNKGVWEYCPQCYKEVLQDSALWGCCLFTFCWKFYCYLVVNKKLGPYVKLSIQGGEFLIK